MAKNRNITLQRRIYAFEGLTGHEKAVALCLIFHRNADNGQCNPSQTRISQETGFGQRTVERALKGLRDKGVITSKRTQSSSWWFFNGLSACQAGPIRPIGGSEKVDETGQSPMTETSRSLEALKQYGE